MQGRRTEEQWRSMMDRYERSGMSQAQFCRKERVPLATFCLWRRKLRTTTELAVAPGQFVEVSLPSQRPLCVASEPTDLVVELPYGVVLRFHGVRP